VLQNCHELLVLPNVMIARVDHPNCA